MYIPDDTDVKEVVGVDPDDDPSVEVLEGLGLPGGYTWKSITGTVPGQDYPVPSQALYIDGQAGLVAVLCLQDC